MLSKIPQLQSILFKIPSATPVALPRMIVKVTAKGICSTPLRMTIPTQSRLRDPNTLSNYDQFLTVHTAASLSIDFEQKILTGNVTLNLIPVGDSKSTEIILDTSFLQIQDVKVDGQASSWELLPRAEPYGSALKTTFKEPPRESENVVVKVR